ncbi:MAG TPA: PrsW family glutamic-type intramembrane protease [Methanoregulaceae archaeon]|nr:PrsW family glutamic-type intramembrane protease [Methanoregulaceae archaeon]
MPEYTLAILLIAFAPGIFWLWYFYHRDRYGPEPLLWIFRVFLLGMLMTVPAALAENALRIVVSTFAISVIAAPLIEESLKYVVVRKTVYETPDFIKPIDGIVYATAASLGFATLENLGYVLISYQTSFPLAIETGLIRAFLSVPAHALFACMWGYALGHAKYRPAPERGFIILKGFLLAVVFHSAFNILLYYDYIGMAVLILVLVPIMWWVVNREINSALDEKYP